MEIVFFAILVDKFWVEETSSYALGMQFPIMLDNTRRTATLSNHVNETTSSKADLDLSL